MRHFLIFLSVITACGTLHAQDPRFSVRGEIELPAQLGNKDFKDIFETVLQMDLAIQRPVWQGLSLGVGAKGGYGVLKERSITPVGATGEMFRTVYYGKLSYEWKTAPHAFFELSMKAGLANYNFKTRFVVDSLAKCQGLENQSGLHLDPSIAYHLLANDNMSFSLTIGYERDAITFGPKQICMDQFPGRVPHEPSGNYSYLTIGLGFVAFIGGDRGREGP